MSFEHKIPKIYHSYAEDTSHETTMDDGIKPKCPICCNYKVRKIFSGYPGYVDGTSFDIMKCDQCNTQFINAPSTPNELYNAIYSLDCVPGYDRYKQYAKQIIYVRNPLNFLSESEFAYEAVYLYLINKPKELKILEVGSGLGYLTFALNKAGYRTTGIDVSETSVRKAINLFGDYYINTSLEEMTKLSKEDSYRFDLIIATELIEHLDDPIEFIKECLPLLDENGSILLTTPYYYDVDKIWDTDMPPIHRFWFSKKSFEAISERLNLESSFIFPNPKKGCFNYGHSNLLAWYIISKLSNGNRIPSSILSADLRGCIRSSKSNEKSRLKKMIIKLITSFPISYFSNTIYGWLVPYQPQCFAVVLRKKKD